MTEEKRESVTWVFDADSVEYFPMLGGEPLVAGDWIMVEQPAFWAATGRSVLAYLRSTDGRLERPTQVVVELDPGHAGRRGLDARFGLEAGLRCRRAEPTDANFFRVAVPSNRKPPELAIFEFTNLGNGKLSYRQITGQYDVSLAENADSLKTLWKALKWASEGPGLPVLGQDRKGDWVELTSQEDFSAYSRQNC